MTPGETIAFVRDTRVFECTLCFRVEELIGVESDELHWEAFWRVRVDGTVFGSLRLAEFQERGDTVQQRVINWYRRERIRRAGHGA
jgi:hypothetical protein